MTVTGVRIFYCPRGKQRQRKLTSSHWGGAEWLERRLKLIREQLRVPEVKGVAIVNLMLREEPAHAPRPNDWLPRLNIFEFSFVCDLQPLEVASPMEDIAKLMQFHAVVAEQAPSPRVRTVISALAQPLTDEGRMTLQPFLRWPPGPGSEGYLGRFLAGAHAG